MTSSTTRKQSRTPRTAAKPAPKPAPVQDVEPPVADYDLGAVVDQRRDALGHDGDMVTFRHAGEVFEFPHPLFADDDWKEGLAEVASDVEFGIYLLGEEQYERFRELDGRASHLAILIDKIQKDARDVDTKGRPTQLSTFSRAQRRRQRRT